MNTKPTTSPARDALIEHALQAQVPDSARRRAAIFLEDTVMVGLAGSATPERDKLVTALGCESGPARLWGDGRAQSLASAALINAYQIHCQEFDCVHEAAVVHPMAVIGGALVSWAQVAGSMQGPIRGRDLLDAICVAVDGATVLGMMARSPMRFFRPAMCGALGASLGLARLAGLDATSTRTALGLTYCQISGNMQSHIEGTSGLALQIGVNARAAIGGIKLAMAGMQGPEDVLDGPFGYLELIEQDYSLAPLARLGKEWQIEQVSHKPFPTGRAAHATLDALTQLLQQGTSADDIQRIDLYAPPLIRRLVDRPAAADMSASYARLCLPWLVSTLLARGRIDLDDFSPAALADPDRWARVEDLFIHADDNLDPNALVPQRLEVTSANGKVHQIDLPQVLGSPARPLDDTARNTKAQACWRFAGIDDERGRKLLHALANIHHGDDLQDLFQHLAPDMNPAT